MNTNLTAEQLAKQIAFRHGEAHAKQLVEEAQNCADGLGASQLFTLEEIKLAGSRVRVKGTALEAAELLDMLSNAGPQRGDMMLEYTKQTHVEAFRALLRELGVDVPCDCGAETCTGEMQEGCGHTTTVAQMELYASLEEGHDNERR